MVCQYQLSQLSSHWLYNYMRAYKNTCGLITDYACTNKTISAIVSAIPVACCTERPNHYSFLTARGSTATTETIAPLSKTFGGNAADTRVAVTFTFMWISTPALQQHTP